MRLINVKTMELEELFDESTIKYAILSHRWGRDEVSFQDFQDPDVRISKEGFAKIKQGCVQAEIDGYPYFWCDTCCINKYSTAELSEAINSMFRWYERSGSCYVYLADVSDGSVVSSEWFERGWTLQELIAPTNVIFYDQHWNRIGTRHKLAEQISERTRIPRGVLTDGNMHLYSIAQRMSWAAGRRTSRAEDMAYSLLGMFNVNIPLLYGEGEKAFVRLQEELIKYYDDPTIFSWRLQEPGERDQRRGSGLLAMSPETFVDCKNVVDVLEKIQISPSTFALTNQGLQIKLWAREYTTDTYLALLECSQNGPYSLLHLLGIFLQRRDKVEQYSRVSICSQSIVQVRYISGEMDDSGALKVTIERGKSILFRQKTFTVRQRSLYILDQSHQFWVQPCADGFSVNFCDPKGVTLASRRMAFDPARFQPSMQIDFRPNKVPFTSLKLALDQDLNVVCLIEFKESVDVISTATASGQQWFDLGQPLKKDSSVFDSLVPGDIHTWSRKDSTRKVQLYYGIYAIKGSVDSGFDVKLKFAPHANCRLQVHSHVAQSDAEDPRTETIWRLNIYLDTPIDLRQVLSPVDLGNFEIMSNPGRQPIHRLDSGHSSSTNGKRDNWFT